MWSYVLSCVSSRTGPMRVWLQHADAPGLMVTRSLGDDLAHSVGVTAEPEVSCG